MLAVKVTTITGLARRTWIRPLDSSVEVTVQPAAGFTDWISSDELSVITVTSPASPIW